jgi:dynein heavy chain
VPLNIVLFKEAIQYLCKIDRVLNIKGGNLLFIGEGGTGRNSLTKLSAFMNEFKVYDKCKG